MPRLFGAPELMPSVTGGWNCLFSPSTEVFGTYGRPHGVMGGPAGRRQAGQSSGPWRWPPTVTEDLSFSSLATLSTALSKRPGPMVGVPDPRLVHLWARE